EVGQQGAEDGDNPVAARGGPEHARDALLGELSQRVAQMLRPHRVVDLDAAQDFRGEARQASHAELRRLGQRVADPQGAVVRNAENVSRPGLLGQVAFARQEEHRVLYRHRLAGARILQLHAALEPARAHADKGDAIAMLRVDIGLHLEHKAGDLVFFRRYGARLGWLPPRRRRKIGDAAQEFADAEIIERAAKEYRGQMTLAERLQFELRAQPARHLNLLAQILERPRRQQPCQLRVVEPGASDRLDDLVPWSVMHAA